MKEEEEEEYDIHLKDSIGTSFDELHFLVFLLDISSTDMTCNKHHLLDALHFQSTMETHHQLVILKHF